MSLTLSPAIRALLTRGMLAGLLGSVCAFATATALGEPAIEQAISFEAHHAAPSEEIVSREVQRTVGLMIGLGVLGIVLGGLVAIAFCWFYGRLGRLKARSTAAVIALIGFTIFNLVPFTKYPAEPPGVGDSSTVDQRTAMYFVMIAVALAAAVSAWRLAHQLTAPLGAWNAALIGASAFAALVIGAELILPAMSGVPSDYPADVLYRFRLASLATSGTLWVVLGLALGAAAERLLESRLSRARAAGI